MLRIRKALYSKFIMVNFAKNLALFAVNKIKMRIKLYILFLFTTTLFAQKVTTSIDTTRNKIGAEFQLTLKASVNKKDKVVFQKLKTLVL